MANKKVYYLSTCNTCKKIMAEVGVDDSFETQDIKTEKITEAQIEEMEKLAGSYEALFSRKSRKYTALNLKEKTLSESEYKKYILEEYECVFPSLLLLLPVFPSLFGHNLLES